MPASVKGKDVVEKIIDFLRKNDGRAVISQTKDAKPKFGCTLSLLNYWLHKLLEAGVIKTSKQLKAGVRKVEFVLAEEFREGDSWREALKQKSPSKGPEAGPAEVHGSKCQNEECLRAREVLLEELVGTFRRLKTSQEDNRFLRSGILKLQKELTNMRQELRDLRDENKKKTKANLERRVEVEKLEAQLQKLRNQTSQRGATMNFDDSGVMILPNEGLPDRS